MSSRRRKQQAATAAGGIKAVAGVAVVVVLVWLPALWNGFSWDDRQLIVENRTLREPGVVKAAFTQDFWESEEGVGRSDY